MTPFRDLAYAGYGILFISHATEKPYKDDSGTEYNKIVPALPNRPFNLINKMVDIIGYIREIPIQNGDKIERKRFIFFRGDERFLTKSRFKYIVPKTELTYENYVNAIYDAIDEEIKHTGGTTTEINPHTVKTFDTLMEEAKELWNEKMRDGKQNLISEILLKVFGKEIRFSQITEDQKDLLEDALDQIRELD